MDADAWVITVASVSAAVLAGIAALQGREKRQRELERDETEWDVPLMVGPEVVVWHRAGPTATDVVVHVYWDNGRSTGQRAATRADDKIRIAVSGWVPLDERRRGTIPPVPYEIENDVTVDIDWRTPLGTPRSERFVTGAGLS